jgi:hypothetical protein
LRVESMIDESYILPADGCEAATYTSQDRRLRIIGVEKMSALHHADGHSGVPTPCFPIPEMWKILVKDCSSPLLRSRPLTKEIGSEWAKSVYADTPTRRHAP